MATEKYAAGVSTENTGTQMGGHPDVVTMEARYERLAESPTAQLRDGMMVLTGLFVALSAWIVGFGQFGGIAVNNLIIGLVLAVLGASFAVSYERSHRLSWVVPALGAWTIVAIWAISGTEATLGLLLSNILGGGIIALLGLAAMLPLARAHRRSRM